MLLPVQAKRDAIRVTRRVGLGVKNDRITFFLIRAIKPYASSHKQAKPSFIGSSFHIYPLLRFLAISSEASGTAHCQDTGQGNPSMAGANDGSSCWRQKFFI